MDTESIKKKLDKDNSILKAKVASGSLLRSLLTPYDIKIIFRDGEWAHIGRDSLYSLIGKIHTYKDSDRTKPCLKVGSFLETGANVHILSGGEHNNNLVINQSLTGWINLQHYCQQQKISLERSKTKGPIEVGANVTISMNSTILSGITIGNGAVIGAGAVITRDVPHFAIVAGNPARIIGYRFDPDIIDKLLEIRWWDFNQYSMIKYIKEIQTLHTKKSQDKILSVIKNEDVYHKNNRRFLLFQTAGDGISQQITFAGIEVDGKITPPNELPEILRFFISQVNNKADDVTYFIPDIFKMSNLDTK